MQPSLKNELHLLSLIRNGDEFAFKILFDFYRPKIYNTAYKIVGDAEWAKDILQDIFLKVWLKREVLSEVETFPAWIATLARNHIFDAIKTNKRGYINKIEADRIIQAVDPARQFDEKQIQDVIAKAIARLPEKQRETYNLMKVSQFSRFDAAKILKVSPETVKTNLENAMRNIRAYCKANLELALLYLFLILY